MKIINILLLSLVLIGCQNKVVDSDYQLFFNDYENTKGYLYYLKDEILNEKYNYQGVIEKVKKDDDAYYVQSNYNLKRYLNKSDTKSSNKIDLVNEQPLVFQPNQNDLYYTSNYIKDNYLIKQSSNNITKYQLENYFVNHLLTSNDLIYLIIENQESTKQYLHVLKEDLSLVKKVELKEKISLNSTPILDNNNLYYASQTNNLIKIDDSFKVDQILKLKNKHVNKLVINEDYLFYNNYDVFSEEQENVIYKVSLKNNNTYQKVFNNEIVDFKINQNELLVLNKHSLNILDKDSLKTIKKIAFDLNYDAIRVE